MKDLSFEEYQRLAMVTCKDYDNIREAYANIGLGLAGESGEVVDIIKKYLVAGKEIDKNHLVEELGDVMWYIAEACKFFDLSMQEIARVNIEKMAKRYPNGFDGLGIR